MRGVNVETHSIKQRPRHQIARGLYETELSRQLAPIEQVFVKGQAIIVDRLRADTGRGRRHHSTETTNEYGVAIGGECNLFLDLAGQPLIIIVKKRNPLTSCVSGTDI